MTTSIENMDAENSNLEKECEFMMETVVEYRKVFGKKCKDYEEKYLKLEAQLLSSNLLLLKHPIKPKQLPLEIDYESMNKDVDVFKKEILANQKRRADLNKKLKDTQEVLLQLKNDKTTRNLTGPFDAETLLAQARNNKGVQCSSLSK